MFDRLNEIDDKLVIEEIEKMEKVFEMNNDTHALKELKSRKKDYFCCFGFISIPSTSV
jgi:hypothetical protein